MGMSKTKKQTTIADMQELAKRKGGKCLSEKFETMLTKMVWQCEIGHIWEARTLNIKKGCWCPICARAKRREWNGQPFR
jgi:hypothetical protein